MDAVVIDRRTRLHLEKLAIGAYAPVDRFMTEEVARSVVERMRLPGGRVFPLPILLPIPDPSDAPSGRRLALRFDGEVAGWIDVESRFRLDLVDSAVRLFGTADPEHPGVRAWLGQSGWFAGGPIGVPGRGHGATAGLAAPPAADPTVVGFDEPKPAATRALFAARGWSSIVGFQTRNIPHRAHEHLHRLALETADGLFIQPLVGPRKAGDYTTEAVMTAYRAYVESFLPADRVVLAPLTIPMWYAGPREAVLHAIVRRNYGCTHFIVGRDHAGVGGWYGRYEAQELARRLAPEIGIEILAAAGPCYCSICGQTVTERTCPHITAAPSAVTEVSGSAVRAAIRSGGSTLSHLVRPEVVGSIAHLQPFLEAES